MDGLGPPGLDAMDAAGPSTNVLMVYRMGQVEANLTRLNARFDVFVSDYPTTSTLKLMLEPLVQRVSDLEQINKDREKAEDTKAAQLKIALVIAAISPIFSAIVSFFVAVLIGGKLSG